MRRVLLATVTIVVVVTVSFGVGWVMSGSEERAAANRSPSVAQLKPLPVPRVVIPNGPWADPHPTLAAPAGVAPQIPRGLLEELFWAMGIDLETGAIRVN